ncbi:FimV/HubP family polar landmark protein [Curvibacter sp. APW13]|uniref:FimV/HubP family polar landmark protein n=1 Tax=Curvibacter sp. APW13 TaxID=3077236 RepID=UPI0028DFCF59|nr:FimV/HubP family polar landmark protein [Curvibacter sp. APW13]MDT8989413.1 FimV/HubP family polar landmark protein [Curvibacter sp. APW13]
MRSKSQHWQRTAMAAAAAALLGMAATDAMALSLGRLTVQSALGEPLRAEIDILDINADEAASLRTTIAPPAAFSAAGLEYNAAIGGMRTSLQKRADGRSYIRLSTDRTINDPFVDLILEVNWASGRIVRDYTMLFDPPALRTPAPAPSLAQTPAAASAQPAQAANAAPASAAAPAAAAQPAPVAAAKPSTKAASKAKAESAEKPASTPDARQVTVKAGDTAGKIAANNKPAGVSLDQMLVALLATNPDAFVEDNINRLRKGAVLTLPSSEQAQAVPAEKARQIVVAQSKDFNSFRKNLATAAPLQNVDTKTQQASGKIESKVEDKKPATAAPDKLTLNKGSVQAKADDKIAKERAEKEAKARAAELEKNLADLNKLKAGAAPAAPAATAAAPASAPAPKPAPGLTVAANTTPAPPAAAPVAPASAPAPVAAAPAAAASAPAATASAPAAPASAPAKKPVVDTPVPASVPIEEPSLVDELIDNPMTPLAAGGLLALIGGFAFWRVRQRKKNAAQVDSSFLESRLQPDSFFGASGGQRIDTANENGAPTGSSMVYSPSQLDAADDVDPVAEADVYLAYGRDLQAEEILKEAAKTTPGRLAVHTKLLEIFAKRKDARSFEASATQAYKITGPNSQDWTRICEMGQAIDPQNPLYQPGGAPTGADAANISPSSFEGTVQFKAAPAAPEPVAPAAGIDLDLDLDFSLDDAPASAAISDVTGSSAHAVSYDQTVKMEQSAEPAAPADDGGLDFDLPDVPVAAPAPAMEPVAHALPEISLDLDAPSASSAPDFGATSPLPVDVPAAASAPGKDGMLEFDLGSLSMDLDTPAPEQPMEAPSTENEDPLETKLALAEEFVSIGDEDGARALIEEVLAEATGATREKAQRALSQLS